MPLAILQVHAVGSRLSKRRSPDSKKMLIQLRHLQQVENRHRTACVLAEDRQCPGRAAVVSLHHVLKHSSELGYPAPTREGRLEIVLHQFILVPLLVCGATRAPTHGRRASGVIRHEGCQCQSFVEIEHNKVHGASVFIGAEVPFEATHLQSLGAHPWVVHEFPQGFEVRIQVRTDPAHIRHESKVVVVRIVAGDLAKPQYLGARLFAREV
mmetsp:Transcript_13832/g.37544  ORF Transcript_13832/g.37544 Transcript_13832/m.37544 type:complete len:211 (-) Transcript_13832:733-1365(-)